MLEPAIRDLAQGKNFGTISFHMANGTIGTHVMWVDADDEHVMINTEVHRAKYQAMQANPTVTVAIWDTANPYRYAEVRGTVVGEVRGQQARDHIDACSLRYTGNPYGHSVQSERVIVKIAPVRQRSKGL